MRPTTLFLTLLLTFSADVFASAQTPTAATSTSRICMDVAHKSRFWHDPADMPGMDAKMIDRVKYMTGEFVETATAVNARLSYLKKEIALKDRSQAAHRFPSTTALIPIPSAHSRKSRTAGRSSSWATAWCRST
jgi:hypothetical protein